MEVSNVRWPFASWFIVAGLVVLLTVLFNLWNDRKNSNRNDLTPEGKSVESLAGFKPAMAKARQIYGQKVTKATAATYIVLVAYLGAAKKKPLYVQLEDSMWIYAPARAGKTWALQSL